MLPRTLAAVVMIAASATSVVAAPSAAPVRPAADIVRDAARKPATMIEFAGIKKGDTVLELLPGGGYFTRVLSIAVGPKDCLQSGCRNEVLRYCPSTV